MKSTESNRRVINGIIEKQCSTCYEWFIENYNNFYYHNKKYPEKGFISMCKKCSSLKAYKYNKAHPEEYKESMTRTRYKDIDRWRERNKKLNQKWRDNGGLRDWSVNNKDKVKEYNEKRAHKNHEITK